MNGNYASYQFMPLSAYRRVIVISDLHGDPEGYRQVKEMTGFAENDALVIVGDLLEKGADSLGLVRAVMQDAQQGNVFVTAGNNDRIFTMWEDRVFPEEEILLYLNSLDMKNSILANMAAENGFVPDSAEKLEELHRLAESRYAKEARFLRQLPVILESEDWIFVHAGLKPGPLDTQEEWYCLTAPEFARQPYTFDKPVITGHWPVTNYSGNVITKRVYHDPAMPCFCIDGGNSMKVWGQINWLILTPGKSEWESGYCDGLPAVRILEDQPESRDPVTLLFPHTRVTVEEEKDGVCTCWVPYIRRHVTLKKENIYIYKDRTYSRDYTNYHPFLQKGETVGFCEVSGDEILIKKDGIIGLYRGHWEFL